jgi:hypothetical protein
VIRALAVVVALSAPGVAEARCHGSWTIGVSSCHHFGTWDEAAVAVGLELSQGMLDIGYVESRFGTTQVDAGRVRATGGMFRLIFYAWPHVYLGGNFGLSVFDDPLLRASGSGFTQGFLAGTRVHEGPFSFSAELSPEINIASVGVLTSQLLGAIQARARADIWLSPTWTIGAMAGINVIDADLSFGVGFAFHPFPYDLTR